MLRLHHASGIHILQDVYDFSIVTEYEGNKTLQFSMAVKDPLYALIQEESKISYDTCRYLVKQINERSQAVTITCDLDMDDWKQRAYLRYESLTPRSFADLMKDIMPPGWQIIGAETVSGSVSIAMDQVNDYQLLMEAKKWYGITYAFANEPIDGMKTIRVQHPSRSMNKGLYISEELNLTKLEVKGDSTELITRLYPYSTTDDVTMDITSVNNGKAYIEDHTYSDKVVSAIWVTGGYSNPADLLVAAQEQLLHMSRPQRTYSCSILDLANMNPAYSMLAFHLYDKVTLLDPRRKTSAEFMICSYTEYPLEPQRNEVELSNDYQKINGTVQGTVTIEDKALAINSKESLAENVTHRDPSSEVVRIAGSDYQGSRSDRYESVDSQMKDSISHTVSKRTQMKLNGVTVQDVADMQWIQTLGSIVMRQGERTVQDGVDQEAMQWQAQWNKHGMVLTSLHDENERYCLRLHQQGMTVEENGMVLSEIQKDSVTSKTIRLREDGSLMIGPFLLQHRSNGHLTWKKGE